MSAELVLNLSENACRRIGLLSQVPPIPMLSFVRKSREKTRVGNKILSENRFERKLGEKR
jgi:hypothetical protein